MFDLANFLETALVTPGPLGILGYALKWFYGVLAASHRPLSSSFLGLLYRILNTNHKEELLRGLWVKILRGCAVLSLCMSGVLGFRAAGF